MTIHKLKMMAQPEEPVVTMSIDGLVVRILPHWVKNKIPVDEIISAALYHDSVEKTEKYLRNKYEGFNGIPVEFIHEETGLELNQVKNWLVSLGMLESHQRLAQTIKFVPFDVAAQMSIEAV